MFDIKQKGDLLAKEGDPQDRMFIIKKGTIVREKEIGGQVHIAISVIN